ncbi:MAG: FAD-dependent oxidoreductase [Pseudoflavonifractor sp.]|nr:FAD-dependent oxidoreductase [Pseudoflavonifractor sp.]
MGKRVLIVGGVAGGASCAARLRRLDGDAEIILFERGEYISYANCGLPYHIGDVIKSRDALLLQTPAAMRAKYGVDVRVGSEVTAIDRAKKTVTVRKAASGETYEEAYDTLVLSTGSSPVRPPIPGIESERIMTLWTVPDADRIRNTVREQKAKSAVVVGGGFIGLEMAENLHRAGLEVTLVEMLPQVMAPLDFEMAQLLHENLEQNGVKLYLGDGVSSFADADGQVTVSLKSGKTISAGLVILSIGTRPNSELAKAAGLEVNGRGGVVTDNMLRTSDPNIYAIGDVIEVEDFIDKSRTSIPLAGPANRQGRIAANNIAGGSETYGGSQGTAVAQVFDLTAASTGQNEKALAKRGLARGKDYESVIITQNSHAGYYPGATPLTLKLLFSMDGKKLFGAQIVGHDGVDKRIDTIATVIRLGGGVEELKSLELAYAPPYSSAKDPVNMAGFTAENVLTGKVKFALWDAVERADKNTVLLDVREDAELMAFSLPGAQHIPLGQLRGRLEELDRSKTIIPFCAIGVRSYNAARTLMQNGFEHVLLYPAGTNFYRSTHYKDFDPGSSVGAGPVADSGMQTTGDAPVAAMRLDCSGMQCPGPIMKVFEAMKNMTDGQVMEVSASDPGFLRDIAAWCRRTGNTLLSSERRGNEYVALVKKGTATSVSAPAAGTPAVSPAEGKTIIVFSGDLDKVLASFIIANGAAAMGRPVTVFFTFWGLNVLRKPEKQGVKKSPVESMFGGMMHRGVGKLKLSRMNMGGMGTAMMKRVMNDKHIDSLEDLIKKAMKAGVKMVACTMSMDVMGIRKEELIDGVELGGVGAYLGDAEESNVNLFI